MTVISDRHQLAFIHIPKCAGSTIMRGLKRFNTFKQDCARPCDDPVFGRINFDHLPLTFFHRHYPDIFQKFCDYESYAILREPRRRFSSAILNYLPAYEGKSATRNSLPWVRERAYDICEKISDAQNRTKVEFALFQRQYDFVYLQDKKIIRNLYPIEQLPLFAQQLELRHNITIDVEDRYNVRLLADGPVTARIKRFARPLYTDVLPHFSKSVAKALFRKLFNGSVAHFHRDLFLDPKLSAFVDEFYSSDAKLYRRVVADFAVGGVDRQRTSAERGGILATGA